MTGIKYRERICVHCGESPIRGYRYCSPECRVKETRKKARKGLSHDERNERRLKEINGVGFKICIVCGVNKSMADFPSGGKRRRRKSYCKECYAKKQRIARDSNLVVYRPRKDVYIDLYSKQCTKCGAIKSYSDYDKSKRLKGGISSWCKSCKGRGRNKYYKSAKERGWCRAIKDINKYIFIIKKAKKAVAEEKEKERRKLLDLRLEAKRVFLEWRRTQATEDWLKEFQRAKEKRYWENGGKERDKIYRKKLTSEQKEKRKWARRANKMRREVKLRALEDGTITAKALKRIKETAKTCPYCGININKENAHLDHMTPISKGGVHSIYNVIMSCAKCNIAKNNMSFKQWMGELEEPYRTNMRVDRYNRGVAGFLKKKY